jgi:class 3 adenylate cyclase
MALTCPHCRWSIRDSARYCDNCGTHVGQAIAGPGIEKWHGTFAFCDLVQSTELASRLDVEDLLAVFDAFRRCVADICKRHRGFVIRFIGDGAFLSFAFPDVIDDAPASAVRAALELASTIGDVSPVPGVNLRLRIGIATGTVVVGELADEAAVKEVVVVGLVPHLAARLAAAAAPGKVVIDSATQRLAGHYFSYQDLGALELKGFAARQQSWQVEGETDIASRYGALRSSSTRNALVGREHEFAVASAAWQSAARRRGGLLSITGEPGVGKSRLARELVGLAVREGGEVIELDCMERASNTPLYPVGVLMRRLAGITARMPENERSSRAREFLLTLFDPARVDAVLNSLASLFGLPTVLDAAEGDTSESMRARTIDALVETLVSRARRNPMLVLCEDLHWSDPTTVEVLRKLSAGIAELPVLLVTTTRSGGLLGEDEAGGHPAATIVALSALSTDDARSLAFASMAGNNPSAELVEEIVGRSGGVPLFIEELARYAGDLDAGRRPSERPIEGHRVVAANVIDIVQPRVDRLGSLKPVVQAAAVVGRQFQLVQLADLLSIGTGALSDALTRLVEYGLLEGSVDRKSGRLRFRHALIHDAVYESTLKNERKRLHLRLAQQLAASASGEVDATADVVAHHFFEAGHYAEAAQYFLRAATDTAARAAYSESAAHSLAGIECLDHVSDAAAAFKLRLELTTALALALAATKGYAAPEVEQAYEAVRALCGADGDPLLPFPVVRGLASFYQVRCDLRATDDLCAKGIELAERQNRPDFMIDILAVQGYNHVYQGKFAEGRASLERCIALYEQYDGRQFKYAAAQDPANAAWSELAIVAWLQGDSATAERSIERALAHAESLSRPFDVAYARCHAAALRNLQRRFAEANEHATFCKDISLRHGFKVWIACGMLQSGVAGCSMHNPGEAVAILSGVLQAWRGAGAELNVPYFMWGLARGQAASGDVAAARKTAQDALQLAQLTGEAWCVPELMLLAADLEEDAAAASDLRRRAAAEAETMGATTLALRAHLGLDPRPSLVRAVLDGAQPVPPEEDWIGAALRALRAAA